LVDFQKVLVVGSHFSPNASLASVECGPGTIDINSCDLSTVQYMTSDAQGSFVTRRPVRRLINVNGTTIDCAAPTNCVLGAGNIANYDESAGSPITFDPSKPPVPTKLVAIPSTNLRDHQLVTVKGSGFFPGSYVYVAECSSAALYDCAYETQRFGTAGPDGTFTIENYALERQFSTYDPQFPSEMIDCAASPGTCALTTQAGAYSTTPVSAPLTFNPAFPPVVPAISVTPSTGLADLQLVNVRGYGFLPGSQVYLYECATAVPGCDGGTTYVTAGFHGQFSLTMAARRRFASPGPNGVVPFDCAVHLGACAITAQSQSSFAPTTVALGFDPAKPPATPAAVVVPNQNLLDNQRVGVLLHGFAPFSGVTLLQCGAEAVTNQDFAYCDSSNETVANTPASGGDPSASFFVHTEIAGRNGLIDCTTPGACVLIATTNSYYPYGGFATAAGAAPRVAGPQRPSADPRALPAPDLSSRPLFAAPGSTIPATAVVPLQFRPR
jgi:hypothetical protein